ncbi:cathepsin L-like [Uloborus diversus]|uniref:cathepsin L-like n=1 Tax=Uloborus diversus TaxID=327109 RepID=UPI00240A5E4D|nr:cathepsin L-like [Uloborus diversus]
MELISYMFRGILFVVFITLATSAPFHPNFDQLWQRYKEVFKKEYTAYEEGVRRLIWEKNVANIQLHNIEADLQTYGFKLGINHFTDRAPEEFNMMNGLRVGNRTKQQTVFLPPSHVEYPTEVDWRKEGLVTEVKDQGKCGSCWAFSSTGSLEGQHKKKTGKLVSLSEQNLVDCASAEGNAGCHGGLIDFAFAYIKKNHGIDTEESYPYVGVDEKCMFKPTNIGATLTGWVDIEKDNEEHLLKAVATVGPVSVAINAEGYGFMEYKTGVYDVKECDPQGLNHGVLVVGYGTENGKDYWIVKNSWGPHWGENGYVKMARNKNLCGIAALASYPLMLRFAVALAFLALAYAASFTPELDQHWEEFKKLHSKLYEGNEEYSRRLIWEANLAKVLKHNIEADLKQHSFKLGVNFFSDMTTEEVNSKFNGYKPNKRSPSTTFIPPSNIEIPDEVDWREQGLVTEVKNQGQCGSCWAFSTTGSVEGQHKKKTGKLVSLSEQQLMDCSGDEGNQGCNGGLMDNAFKYIKKNGGIDTEASYPYEEAAGTCRFKKENVGATVSGYVDIPSGDEKALLQAVATVGPVSVAIDASHFSFQLYSDGVYDEESCSSTELDHGVLVIGYGSEDGHDYWLVKNSWGASWGIQGYIKMSRNKNNQCGIATSASYPLV